MGQRFGLSLVAFRASGRSGLHGRYLIPLWRLDRPQGVNVRRMFKEPRSLDKFLIFAGPDTTIDTRLRIMGGGLQAHFLWFN